MSHQHDWIEAKEIVEAVYPLKKNSAGTKEIRVSGRAIVCRSCPAVAIKSPWTGAICEVEAIQ